MMASLVSAPNFDTGENEPSFLGSLPSGIKSKRLTKPIDIRLAIHQHWSP